jgi:hypothetical protein
LVDGFAAELVTLVPWDDDRRGIPSRFVDHPRFSWYTPDQARRVRAPVPLRLDSEGGINLLGDAGILHLDGGGEALGRTPLPDHAGRVIDFACDPESALPEPNSATGKFSRTFSI